MKEHLRQYLIEKLNTMLPERRAVPSKINARELEAGIKDDLQEVMAELEQNNIICDGTTLLVFPFSYL